MSAIRFSIENRDARTRARVGVIRTPHGDIHTPAFIPVGTKATVKGVLPEQLVALGAQAVLANTYHLFLQPGDELVRDAGGLGEFMRWDGPTITDSGGFQVFSLGDGFNKGVSKMETTKASASRTPQVFDERILTQHGKLALVDDEGVTFTSHLDGSLHRFTPERSVEIQHNLGADIFFAFDECTSPTAEYDYQKEAMLRTHRWAQRSLYTHRQNLGANSKQGIFGIVQGGRYADLREESSRVLAGMDFDGYGIGGSFSKEDLGEALSAGLSHLPEEKPRHRLGIGEPEDILRCIEEGIDTFDCVAATRIARTGTVYTTRGPLNLTKSAYKSDLSAVDESLPRSPLAPYTRAYLAHLFRAGEMLGPILASQHNLYFILKLVDDAREALRSGVFEEFVENFQSSYYS